jgi:VPDSG-CTERM motif
MKRHMLAATTVVALLFLLTVGAPHASADIDTFNFTSCHISGGCPAAGTVFGTVKLTDTSGGVLFDVVLTSGNTFVETGAGAKELFLFNAPSGTNVNLTNMTATYGGTDVTSTLGGLTYVYIAPPGAHADGTGDFTGSIECTIPANCNGGSGTQLIDDLHFTVTNETRAQLETYNTLGNIFVADIMYQGDGTLTGPVDVSIPPGVPDGGMTLMLLGGALFGLETLRRKIRA